MNAPSGSRQVTQDKAAARPSQSAVGGGRTDGRTQCGRPGTCATRTPSTIRGQLVRPKLKVNGPHTQHSEPPQARVHAGASGTAVTTKP